MILRAVTVNVEAAHRDTAGRLHGHSYLVECWTERDVDLADFQIQMRELAASVDHSLLEDSLGGPRMEDIAAWFLASGLARVIVRRPTLGCIVEMTP
jgi:6-pyruvoyl-tetrahydropterin synthase